MAVSECGTSYFVFILCDSKHDCVRFCVLTWTSWEWLIWTLIGLGDLIFAYRSDCPQNSGFYIIGILWGMSGIKM